MKKCTKCKELKSLEDFNKQKTGKEGLISKCKDCQSYYGKEYFIKNKEKVKLYKLQNKDKLSINKKTTDKNFHQNNPSYMKDYWKSYYRINKDNISLKQKLNRDIINSSTKQRRQNDPIFKLKGNIRSLVKDSFLRFKNKTYRKSQSTESLLGCTMEEFINHLQSKFTEGMALENHGEWEMDHIIPLASAKTEEEIIKLNHYTNFQPLWRFDNRSKGAKLI